MKTHPVVWRRSNWLMSYQQDAWHARLNGCRLAVAATKKGTTGAAVERTRARDGGTDTVDRKQWPTSDEKTVLEAKAWCEAQAAAHTKEAAHA